MIPALLGVWSVAAQSALQQPAVNLTLTDYLKQVMERNESVQNKLLEFEFNQRRVAAEHGTFEPELFADYSHDYTKRQNTVEQQQGRISTNLFVEENNIYEGGIESLVPSGARIRLGYTLRDLNNNLPTSAFSTTPHTNAEYQTFFGFTVTQPLLKDAWFPANLAALRVASLSSDLAFQDYRRQMMVIVSTAIATYWDLYLAQEQVRFFDESVATAEKILNDFKSRAKAGRSSELEVLEAQAGLALRRTKRSEAVQQLYEAANKARTLASVAVVDTNGFIRAVDQPRIDDDQFNYFDAWRTAVKVNPDYLSQRLKMQQELVRVAYARNQRLPEFNFKSSFGLNGLGDTPGHSWEDIEQSGYPSWSVGLEMRVPLGGGIKTRNELRAANIRYQETIVGMREVETQIANAVDTALHKISSASNTVQNLETVLDYNENLLHSALAQLDVGRIESRKILDIEADLLDARNSAAQARVQYQRAVLELQLVEGSILKEYQMDMSQHELQSFTADLARRDHLSRKEYQDFIRNIHRAYELKAGNREDLETPAQEEARQALEATMPVPKAVPSPTPANPEQEQHLQNELRKRMDELKDNTR